MEFIEKLLELLKDSPQSAIWALVGYFVFVLSKMAGWLLVAKFLISLFINRYFDNKEHKQITAFSDFFEDQKISSVSSTRLLELLHVVKGEGSYIHDHDINRAIEAIKYNRKPV